MPTSGQLFFCIGDLSRKKNILELYQKTFGKAGALAYLGEAGAHVFVLLANFRLTGLPFAADWFFAILGLYSGVGLVVFAHRLDRRGRWHKFIHGLVTLWTLGSVALHIYIIIVHSHASLVIFPRWYSLLGLTYCLYFAWWLWVVRLQPPAQPSARRA